MKVTKSQKRLLVLLVIVLMYAIFDFMQNRKDYEQVYLKKKQVPQAQLVTNSKPTIKKIEKQLKDIDLNWKRETIEKSEIKRRSVKTAPQKVHLNLNAVTYAGENSFVIINNIILKEGEVVAGYRVDKIHQDHVKLTKNSKSFSKRHWFTSC